MKEIVIVRIKKMISSFIAIISWQKFREYVRKIIELINYLSSSITWFIYSALYLILQDFFQFVFRKLQQRNNKNQFKLLQNNQNNNNQSKQQDNYCREQQDNHSLASIHKKKIIVGETATGKTSLINHFFQLKLPIGMGDCTTQTSQVYQTDSVKIFDSKALQSNQFSSQQQHYQILCEYDQIFVCFCTSLKGITKFIEYLVERNKIRTVYFIRTKCDNFDQKQLKTFQEEIKTDKQFLIKCGATEEEINIYGVSVKKTGFIETQNQKVKLLMIK